MLLNKKRLTSVALACSLVLLVGCSKEDESKDNSQENPKEEVQADSEVNEIVYPAEEFEVTLVTSVNAEHLKEEESFDLNEVDGYNRYDALMTELGDYAEKAFGDDFVSEFYFEHESVWGKELQKTPYTLATEKIDLLYDIREFEEDIYSDEHFISVMSKQSDSYRHVYDELKETEWTKFFNITESEPVPAIILHEYKDVFVVLFTPYLDSESEELQVAEHLVEVLKSDEAQKIFEKHFVH